MSDALRVFFVYNINFMAQRRMFSPQIIDSDAFLEMPSSSQSLYFHLGMRADDDGFVGNPRKIQKITGSSEDDLKILISKRFVLVFENGVIVIKHWRINNLIRKDWYKETIYLEEKSLLKIKENGAYTLANNENLVNENVTVRSRRLGKVSLGNREHSEETSPNKKTETPKLTDLYSQMGLPPKVKIAANKWQDEAANALKYFTDGETKASSIFKCFKDNNQKARLALSDCKELGKTSVLYFLKVFNEIKKNELPKNNN